MPPRRKTDASAAEAGLPLPEQNFELIGQEAAELALLNALKAERLHHAWLITGPRGVGKATLAFRFARFILRYGRDPAAIATATSLAMAESEPVARQVATGAAQDLLVLRKERDEKTGAEKKETTVDVVRRLHPFFGLAAGAGGWRVAIVDPVDDLNRSAANALLKALEEPPERSVLLLLAHVPGRLLPTIRSRCRVLRLAPLAQEDLGERLEGLGEHLRLPALGEGDRVRLAALSGGRVGRALELWANDGLALSRALDVSLSRWPNVAAAPLTQLLERGASGRGGDRFSVLTELLIEALYRAARSGAGVATDGEEGGAAHLGRAAPGHVWASLAGDLKDLFARAQAIHLDEQMVLAEAMRRIAAARV
jgi:DNA polymerase-3 subunit delta'